MYRSNTHRHVHEFLFSTTLNDGHNHRIAGVTREAIPLARGGHIHRFKGNTDFYENHYHQATVVTGRSIYLKNGRHIHYVKSFTSFKDGHRHRFQGSTLIQDPTG